MILDTSTLFVKTYNRTESPDNENEATIAYISGSSFCGRIRETQFDGTGVFTWKDGVSYTGNFIQSRMSGSGQYKWLDCRYTGDVANGRKNGTGTFVTNDGKLSYSGEWLNGMPHGRGACTFANGDHYYGNWKMGKRHGSGTIVYKNGNSYTGFWIENSKSGKGTMIWNKERESFEGDWKDDQPNGYGIYTWALDVQRDFQYPTLNIYKGYWRNGSREGKGIFYYSNGSIYDGQWSSNMKSGPASFKTNNGKIYQGNFEDDQITGKVALFDNGLQKTNVGSPFLFRVPLINDAIYTQVNNVISRNISELQAFFHKYCLETKALNCRYNNVIVRSALWEIMKNSHVGESLASLDRVYAKLFKNDIFEKSRYTDPHNPGTEFTFHDMLEFFFAIAVFLQGETVDHTQIPAIFHVFLNNRILTAAPYLINDKNKDIQWIFDKAKKEHGDDLCNIFEMLARKSKNSLKESPLDNTVSVRESVLFVQATGLLKRYKDLNMKKIFCFLCTYLGVDDKDDLSMDYEMVILDFKDFIHGCVNISCLNLIEEIDRLKSNGFPVAPVETSVILDASPPLTNAVLTSNIKMKKSGKNVDSAKKEGNVTPPVIKAQEKPAVEELLLENVIKEKIQQLEKTVSSFYACLMEYYQTAQLEKKLIISNHYRSKFMLVLTEITDRAEKI